MALPRKNEFADEDLKVSEFAKVMSHPARVAILRVLAKRGECICGELVADLPLAQSSVSQHLKALKDFGLIQGEIDGPKSRYCIDWKVFDSYQHKMSKWTEKMLHLQQKNCC